MEVIPCVMRCFVCLHFPLKYHCPRTTRRVSFCTSNNFSRAYYVYGISPIFINQSSLGVWCVQYHAGRVYFLENFLVHILDCSSLDVQTNIFFPPWWGCESLTMNCQSNVLATVPPRLHTTQSSNILAQIREVYRPPCELGRVYFSWIPHFVNSSQTGLKTQHFES